MITARAGDRVRWTACGEVFAGRVLKVFGRDVGLSSGAYYVECDDNMGRAVVAPECLVAVESRVA